MKIHKLKPVQFESAEELIKNLQSVHFEEVFRPICRGQGSWEEWKLVSSIFRPCAMRELSTGNKFKLEAELVKAEIELINLFLKEADSIGFAVPEDSLQLRKELIGLENAIDSFLSYPDVNYFREELLQYSPWPWPNIITILSLLQHSGLPTRLLDWTTKPLNAAYFAAKQVIENELKGGHLAIYIVQEHTISDWLNDFYNETFFKVTPITAGNTNLVNQKGCFSFHVNKLDAEIASSNHEEFIEVSKQLGKNKLSGAIYLLPHCEAENLLLWLDELNVNRSNLFPSWKGIVESITDRSKANKTLSSRGVLGADPK